MAMAIGSISFAQPVLQVQVKNNAGQPIPYARVVLQTTQKDLPVAQTDSIGNCGFKLPGAGYYFITIEHISYTGYRDSLQISRDTSILLILQEAAKQLNAVVVTGSKKMIESSAEKTTYNIEKSITAAGTDALVAISQIPGIRVNGDEISIAGKGAVKAMVNNRVVQLSGTDLSRFLRSISASEIEKIELISLPPAKYDADGNAGLINIILKRNRKPGFSGNASLGLKYYLPGQSEVFGNKVFGEINPAASFSYVSGKWSTFLNMNLNHDKHLEGFETDIFYPTQKWVQTDSAIYKYWNANINAGADYQVNKNLVIGFSFFLEKNLYDGFDSINNPIYNKGGQIDSTLKTFATYYPIAQTGSFNLHTDIKLDTSGKMLYLNADYFKYYRTDSSDFSSHSFGADAQPIPGSSTRIYDDNKQDIHIYTVKADLDIPTAFANYSFGGKISFIKNYSNAFYYNKTSNDSLVYNTDLSNEFEYTENTQSLYGSFNKGKEKWKLTAGLRAEFTQTTGYSYTLQQTNHNNYIRVFPNLLLSYQKNAEQSYSFSFNRRINRPTFWNLNPYKSLYSPYSYGEGNPSLQPAYSTNAELSHKYKNKLTTTLFFNHTSNQFSSLVFVSPDTNLVFTKPYNFIETSRGGISIGWSGNITTWWESFEQVNAYYTSARSAIPEVQDRNGPGLYISTNNNFFLNKTKTIAAAVNFWHQFHEVDRMGRSHNYYKLDIGGRATLNEKIELSLTLNDALRKSASTVDMVVNGIDERFTNFQFNRYLLLTLNYRFGQKKNNAESRSPGNEDERKRLH